ncbi:Jid1 protein [Saccharomycopsis crataegensis]|uniref:Jid1 protein n=1 Tax=Saccharomycopsis crataegensis TaxID=43959 RepID=A0AAV5QXM8_9ASCO|nr:Jid1 protein [Saccharomycopsis crataegensis]
MLTISKRFSRDSLIYQNIPRLSLNASTIRRASTISDKPEIPSWPSSSNPTPYEILGLTPSEINDSRLLKRKYRELCKTYHPDLSKSRKLLNRKGEELDNKAKEARFKQVSTAYNLLCDPTKRSCYDRFQTGWESTSGMGFSQQKYTGTANYAYAHAHRYNMHDDRFWHAGNWEDYADVKNKQDPDDPIFKSELAKKNREVLIMCCGLMLFFGCVQIAYALDRYHAEMNAVELGNISANNNLLFAYINHGLGLDKWSRLNHFLWNRRYAMYRDDEEEMARQEEDDNKLVESLKEKRSD